mmetsp:Transcript_25086/g.60641  ORF Transcript_25086/g.60641 Transcript_25086/m.60641 type:complete len:223 (+) Transcript_25086:137-805(+)
MRRYLSSRRSLAPFGEARQAPDESLHERWLPARRCVRHVSDRGDWPEAIAKPQDTHDFVGGRLRDVRLRAQCTPGREGEDDLERAARHAHQRELGEARGVLRLWRVARDGHAAVRQDQQLELRPHGGRGDVLLLGAVHRLAEANCQLDRRGGARGDLPPLELREHLDEVDAGGPDPAVLRVGAQPERGEAAAQLQPSPRAEGKAAEGVGGEELRGGGEAAQD